MGLFALGFILGGLFGAGVMALLNARKTDELSAGVEEWKKKTEEWKKKYQDTEKELQTYKLMPVPTITMYRGDMIPIECSIAFDRHDFEEISAKWIENEIVRKLSEGIKPYIETIVTDDFYRMQKVVKGKVIVVKK